uniref:Helitron helicase-like domain-containing protein n=1 Tax=Tanacetum cinerariifolium TaxID=118510 RepID=A0A6L2LQI5_TANCI|nr:hypothetical protein [Tanacetum cinerariifolium]
MVDLEADMPKKPCGGKDDWWCTKCNIVPNIKTMFCLQIRVQEESGTVSLTLWNDEVEDVVDTSAYQIFDKYGKITALVGKKYAFKVSIDEYNVKKMLPVFTVLRLFGDPDIIESICPPATPTKETEATSSAAQTVTPLDLESQTDGNTTPVHTQKNIVASLGEKRHAKEDIGSPSNSKKPIDRNIIREVKDVLDTSSDLVKIFRRARDRYNEDAKQNIRIKLVAKRDKDNITYNIPTTNEVAGLIIGDFDTCLQQRDIVIQKHREGPSESREFICPWRSFVLAILMDGYTMVGTECIFLHHAKQSKLRCDTYSNIRQSIADGNNDPTVFGKPVVLSFSFTSGPRYMKQNYMDAMALCRWYYCLDLFINVTCNPKWPEISRYMREHNLSSTDRPDVLTRVFKMKLDQLMKDVKELRLFGRTQAGTIHNLKYKYILRNS